ncbi:MAG: glycoside hydrolase [Lentinula lateritia]|nr:MAG: glycoside hydrolase [Lentinula lateritia]
MTAAFILLSLPVTTVHSATVSSTPAQTFLGIGGSGAWWPHDLFNFPASVRQNLSSLLFSDSGLGISSYRYNLGGGGVGVSNPVRAPQTPYVSPGVYNFSADPQGTFFLQQASDFGVPGITMFLNTAPAPLTSNGDSCGGQFVSGTGTAYATYIVDVAEHWRDAGINISYISAMNEPDSTFGPVPCGQEGMLVEPSQRSEVVSSLWNELNSRGLSSAIGILADETSSTAVAPTEYSAWLPEVVDMVAHLVHHAYDFPSDANYLAYVNAAHAASNGKTTWMSEICCSLGTPAGTGRGYSQGFDPTFVDQSPRIRKDINNALMFAGLVFQSFVVGGEAHYDFWTLVSNEIGCEPLTSSTCVTTANSNGWTDGMIYYDPDYTTNGNFELYLVKHFWTYKHFGNFVKPGTQRLPLTGSDANTHTLVVSNSTTFSVIAMNPNTTTSTLSLTFPQTVCGTTGFRTSASEDFATISPATGSGETWELPLSATSLSTYIFARKAC